MGPWARRPFVTWEPASGVVEKRDAEELQQPVDDLRSPTNTEVVGPVMRVQHYGCVSVARLVKIHPPLAGVQVVAPKFDCAVGAEGTQHPPPEVLKVVSAYSLATRRESSNSRFMGPPARYVYVRRVGGSHQFLANRWWVAT